VRLPGFPVSFKLWGPRKARPEVAWLEGVGGTSKGGLGISLGKDVAGKSQRMLAAAAWPEKCDSHRGDDAVRQVRQFDSVAAAVNRTAVGSSGV
jgi:hypothetical protein